MKSTKILLSTGIALAIALFASVQLAAMEKEILKPYKANPYLSEQNKKFIEKQVEYYALQTDPEGLYYNPDPFFQAELKSKIETLKKIYYGNKQYAYNEITELLQDIHNRFNAKYKLPATPKKPKKINIEQ